MTSMLIVFFVWLIFCIIFFPFKSRFMAHFDLMELKLFYSAKIWRIKILCGETYYCNLKININNSKNIFKRSYKKKNFKTFTKNIIRKIRFTKFETYFTGGNKTDALFSAMICGSASTIIESFYAFLFTKYDGIELYKDIDPTFTENAFKLTLDSVFQISIFQIFVAWLFSFKSVRS